VNDLAVLKALRPNDFYLDLDTKTRTLAARDILQIPGTYCGDYTLGGQQRQYERPCGSVRRCRMVTDGEVAVGTLAGMDPLDDFVAGITSRREDVAVEAGRPGLGPASPGQGRRSHSASFEEPQWVSGVGGSGWYPDPRAPGLLRWWDGSAWTGHVQPVSPSTYAFLPDPDADLGEVLKAGRAAGLALLVSAGLSGVMMLGMAALVPEAVRLVRDFLTQVQTAAAAGSGTVPFPVTPGWMIGFQAVLSAADLAQFVVIILEVIWVYRATTFVRRTGRPTQLAPGWAVAGFFVPVVNFWFPYVAVRDLLRGSPAVRLVGWWWGSSLASGLILPFVFPAAVVATWLAVAVVLATAVPVIAAPLLLRRIIRASATVHAQLVPQAP
jgi:hypothetical protein